MKNIKVHFKTTDGETETVECPEFNTVMEASRYLSNRPNEQRLLLEE